MDVANNSQESIGRRRFERHKRGRVVGSLRPAALPRANHYNPQDLLPLIETIFRAASQLAEQFVKVRPVSLVFCKLSMLVRDDMLRKEC